MTEDQIRLIDELKGRVCRCGSPKQSGNTFCFKCYKSLPQPIQRALYKRVGDGYEAAYQEAIEQLGLTE